jgi:hypothetical protein
MIGIIPWVAMLGIEAAQMRRDLLVPAADVREKQSKGCANWHRPDARDARAGPGLRNPVCESGPRFEKRVSALPGIPAPFSWFAHVVGSLPIQQHPD